MLRLVLTALLMSAFAGCGGLGGGASEDAASRDQFTEVLRRQHRGVPFSLSAGLPSAHGRVWFFGGYTPESAITEALGHPWPGAPDEVAENDYVVVVDNGAEDVQGFTLSLPSGVFPGCFPLAEPLRPNTRFVLRGPVPEEASSTNYLEARRMSATEQAVC